MKHPTQHVHFLHSIEDTVSSVVEGEEPRLAIPLLALLAFAALCGWLGYMDYKMDRELAKQRLDAYCAGQYAIESLCQK